MAKLTNQFKRTRLLSLITPPTDKHYSLDSEDEFWSNVSHQRHFFSDPSYPHLDNEENELLVLLSLNHLVCKAFGWLCLYLTVSLTLYKSKPSAWSQSSVITADNLRRPQTLLFVEGNHVSYIQRLSHKSGVSCRGLTARRDWLTVGFPSATSQCGAAFFVRQRFVSALALYALRAWVSST